MELTSYIQIPTVKAIYFPGGEAPLEGTICVSAHHILFCNEQVTIQFLHVLILKIDKLILQEGTRCQLVLSCKNFRRYKFEIPSCEELDALANSIESLANIKMFEYLESFYPFYYHPRESKRNSFTDLFVNMQKVLERWECPPNKIVVSVANWKYQLSYSYPEQFIVPEKFSDFTQLKTISLFRERGRFPVISYYHKRSMACLLRSGQPLCGHLKKRCDEDIQLLNACLVVKKRGRIIDTRSKNAANLLIAKKDGGGGTEAPHFYPQWIHEFANMEPTTSLRESFEKFSDLCMDESSNASQYWFSRLDASNWLQNVSAALWTARRAAHYIHNESCSVLIHGTSGTDNTLIVTSLVQLLLDPYCRSFDGFIDLIFREWILGGHPFRERQLINSGKDKLGSPVFLLFLDCIWQLMRQFPIVFEFGEDFLHILHEHTQASEYGTFICNSQKEFNKYTVYSKTESFWKYVMSERDSFINPIYQDCRQCIWPALYPENILVWDSMYLKDTKLMNERKEYNEKVDALCKENRRLREEARELQTQFIYMLAQKLAKECKLTITSEYISQVNEYKSETKNSNPTENHQPPPSLLENEEDDPVATKELVDSLVPSLPPMNNNDINVEDGKTKKTTLRLKRENSPEKNDGSLI